SIKSYTIMRCKTGQALHTRFRNPTQPVHHGYTTIIDALHDAARSLRQLRRITARSSDRLTDVLQRRDSTVALNARIGESGRGLLIRGVFQRRPARDLLQVLQRLLRLRRVTIKARQDSLPLLLINRRLDAANNRRTNRSTHSRASHNSATLRPLAKSPREAITGLLARLLRLLLDITEVLLDFLAQPRRAGQD